MINDAKMDFCGTKLAMASADKVVRIYSVNHKTGVFNKLVELTGYNGVVWQVSWSHPKFGPLLASACYDGRVIIWKEIDADKSFWRAVFDDNIQAVSANTVAWAYPQFGAILATGSNDGSISILSMNENEEWETTRISKAHELGCFSVSWNAFARQFASGGADGNVKIWGFYGGKWILEHQLEHHKDFVFSVEWCPYADVIVSASRDGYLVMWNKNEKVKAPEFNHSRSLNTSNFSFNDTLQSNTAIAAEWKGQELLKYDTESSFHVCWDSMGVLLYVTGPNDKVSIWKNNGEGLWECVSDSTQILIQPSKTFTEIFNC